MHCNSLQLPATHRRQRIRLSMHFNSLQLTATRCNSLPLTDDSTSASMHCDSLQLTATRCNSLQLPAPPRTSQASGEDARQHNRLHTAASTVARVWRCHIARLDFEDAMDRLIEDPGELIKGWAHRLVDSPAKSKHNLPALDLARAAHRTRPSPGHSARTRGSDRGNARSGYMSVMSARSSAQGSTRSGALSPLSSLLVETKQVFECAY